MPFYLICDVSSSMQRNMQALRNNVSKLLGEIAADPLLSDTTFFGVITFSDRADVLMELTPVSTYDYPPEFPAQNLSHDANYGVAFHELAKRLRDDFSELRSMEYRVFRPCVYFLTCTEPSDGDWHQSFKSTLTSRLMASRGLQPIFVPFGFGNVGVDVLRRLAYPGHVKAYDATNATIEDALEEVLDIIQRSIVMSTARSMASGQADHVFPDPDPGRGIRAW